MTVQKTKPSRSAVEPRDNYRAYRDDLRTDFNGSCGYCDDSDDFVDRSCFHIDHFAPQKPANVPHGPFAAKTTLYANLVYSCRFCNNRKRNHWIGDNPDVPNDGTKGFIDPCDGEYEAQFKRLETGAIVGCTDLGRYMVVRLNLSLLRHQVLWNARRTRALRHKLEEVLVRFEDAGLPASQAYIDLSKRYRELTKDIESYELLAINS